MHLLVRNNGAVFTTVMTVVHQCRALFGMLGGSWRELSFAGMARGDHEALLLVPRQDIDRREVENVRRRLYPQHRRNRPWRCWPSMLPILGGAAEESPAGAGLVG